MPEILRQGDAVRLSKGGLSVRITEMAHWQGTILRQVNKDYAHVVWNQRDAKGNAYVWTERFEFLAKA